MLEGASCFAGLDGYRRYLNAARFYPGLEAALNAARVRHSVPDWPRRRKLGLILADINGSEEQADCGVSARQTTKISTTTWGAGDVFGALYVLEGATVGGAVLARRMRDLGPAGLPGPTFGFLDPYGDERGVLWRTFLSQMETVALTPAEEKALGRRAAATFALFVTAGRQLTRKQTSW